MATFRSRLANVNGPANPTNTLSRSLVNPETPPAKRQKTSSTGISSVSFYSTSEFALRSPDGGVTTHRSSTIFSSSHVDSEFRHVLDQGSGKQRKNRRTSQPRNDQARRPAVKSIEPGRDEIEDHDEYDELAERSSRESRSHGKHRFGGDGADSQFFRKLVPAASRAQKEHHKRPEVEEDELAGPPAATPVPAKPGKRVSSNPATEDPPSVSHKGSISRTEWVDSRDAPVEGVSFRVVAAVCYRQYLYFDSGSSKGGNDGDAKPEPCFLQPVQGRNELRAFRGDGRPHEAYHWLKITPKIKDLKFNTECEFVKILQPNEDKLKIGHLMVLKFIKAEVAASAVAWLKATVVGPGIIQDESSRILIQTYENVVQKIKLAIDQKPQHITTPPALVGPTVRSQPLTQRQDRQPTHNSPTKKATSSPPRPQDRDRVPLREQMQLSTRQPAAQEPQTSATRSSLRQRPPHLRPVTSDIQHIDVEPVRWSESNSDWSKNWKIPLTFNRTTVDKDDVPRLDEGQCLNDNLISFGLRYLFDNIGTRHPNLSKRVYMHNSFFYEKLKSARGRQINYEGVRSWTSRVDLFSYDYIIIPVNESYHWWLAIICNPARLDPDQDYARLRPDSPEAEVIEDDAKESSINSDEAAAAEISQLSVSSPKEYPKLESGSPGKDVDRMVVDLDAEENTIPDDGISKAQDPAKGTKKPLDKTGEFRIITLDSLGHSHSPAVTALKTYLVHELKDKKNREAKQMPQQVGLKAVNIPEQDNVCDCGIYLLGYMREFFTNPTEFAHTLLRRERPKWSLNPREQREHWRDVILLMQKGNQEKHLQEQSDDKEKNKLTKTVSKPANTPSPPVKKLGSVESSVSDIQKVATPGPTATTPPVKKPSSVEPRVPDTQKVASLQSAAAGPLAAATPKIIAATPSPKARTKSSSPPTTGDAQTGVVGLFHSFTRRLLGSRDSSKDPSAGPGMSPTAEDYEPAPSKPTPSRESSNDSVILPGEGHSAPESRPFTARSQQGSPTLSVRGDDDSNSVMQIDLIESPQRTKPSPTLPMERSVQSSTSRPGSAYAKQRTPPKQDLDNVQELSEEDFLGQIKEIAASRKEKPSASSPGKRSRSPKRKTLSPQPRPVAPPQPTATSRRPDRHRHPASSPAYSRPISSYARSSPARTTSRFFGDRDIPSSMPRSVLAAIARRDDGLIDLTDEEPGVV